ncbi:MBL fold metallo-hydrolase [Patescibacteria group bacterium]|nr:MBL fold metallo-hydrolase [Patescibacteria group bacterium]
MQIFWHGFSCVRIESSVGDKEASLVTDPYDIANTGVRFPRTLEPNVVVLSHQDRERFPLDVFKNKPFLIADPGEYEAQGMFVFGLPLKGPEQKYPFELAYRFVIEGVSIGFLGSTSRVPPAEELAKLDNIDILLLPVGGGDRLTAAQAVEVVNEIEPRIVIPLYHHIEGSKMALDSVDLFCKELGGKRQDANRLKISRKDLPADDIVISVLERA